MSNPNHSTEAETGAKGGDYPPLWKNPNFLRYFGGSFVTNVGDSLYTVAVLWFVFELSGSTFLTGIASSLLLLPFLLQIVAGPIVDRLSVKPLLVGAQVVQGAVVLVFPIAAYTGNLTVELVLVTIPVLSLMTLVLAPVRATLVPRIVADDQLARSNSALTTVTYGLDMIFDAMGGLVIAIFGATTLFVLDSATFAIAALLFVGMRIPSTNDGGDSAKETNESDATAIGQYVADLRTGIDVLRGTIFVELILTSAVFNLAVGVTLAILPAFGDTLGGPAIYGLLLGALGVGRMVGSASASYLEGVAYGHLMTAGYLVSALLWIGAVRVPSVALTVGLFGVAWITAGVGSVMTETMNQRVFAPEILGRISAIKGTAATATLPIGSLVGGYVAQHLGAVTTMELTAFGYAFAGAYFAVRPPLRRLPPVTDVDAATFDVMVDDGPEP